MDCKDLDLYLLARRQQKLIYVITAVALAVVIASGALRLLENQINRDASALAYVSKKS